MSTSSRRSALSCIDPDAGLRRRTADPGAARHRRSKSPRRRRTALSAGSPRTGKIVYTPNKDFTGTDSFTYTGSDGTSNSPPATVTIHVVAEKRRGRRRRRGHDRAEDLAVRISAKSWRLGKKLASISRVPVGTTISFKLSEAAQATLSFQRKTRKHGRKRRQAAARPSALAAKAGRNKVRFQGLLTVEGAPAGQLPGGRRRQGLRRQQRKPKNGPTFTILAEIAIPPRKDPDAEAEEPPDHPGPEP